MTELSILASINVWLSNSIASGFAIRPTDFLEVWRGRGRRKCGNRAGTAARPCIATRGLQDIDGLYARNYEASVSCSRMIRHRNIEVSGQSSLRRWRDSLARTAFC